MQRWPWLLRGLLVSSALSLLTACGETIVTQGVTFANISPSLMRKLPPPRCDYNPEGAVEVPKLEAARACEAAAGRLARARQHALVDAVRVRQKAAQAIAN